ncbi:hypothetical protein BQ8420_30295 [Nocardiopsis sp. JB363]|nr:hypothetical protein BQ8420_30295 [Nocardiopsis sp. JB363]
MLLFRHQQLLRQYVWLFVHDFWTLARAQEPALVFGERTVLVPTAVEPWHLLLWR